MSKFNFVDKYWMETASEDELRVVCDQMGKRIRCCRLGR